MSFSSPAATETIDSPLGGRASPSFGRAQATGRAFAGNRLLSALADDDINLASGYLERTRLAAGEELAHPGEPFRHVYFLEGGIVAAVGAPPGGAAAEVGMIGREGFVGLAALLGSDTTPHRFEVLAPGEALRMNARDLRRLVRLRPGIQARLLLYAHTHLVQVSETAVVGARFALQQRLARWLLMAQDRLGGDEVPLTHECLSTMLGVRRAGVTVALHLLEGEKIIRARRAAITILDRRLLEAQAGGSYGAPEREYDRLVA